MVRFLLVGSSETFSDGLRLRQFIGRRMMDDRILSEIQNVIDSRKGGNPDKSYVAGLLADNEKLFDRTIEADLNQTDLLAMSVQVIDNLFEGIAEGTHADNNAVGVFYTVVIEQTVVSTKLSVDLVHVIFNDCWQLVVNLVACLAVLEEDIAVLVGTTA